MFYQLMKQMMPKPKRVNKSKDQLIADLKNIEKINREKTLVKLMFPYLKDQKSIYDAQTVLGALSGFVKIELDKKVAALLIKDLEINLDKEQPSEIKTAIISLIGLLELENAQEMAKLLERFGNTLAQYSAHEFMKHPISEIKIENIVSE